MNSKLGYIIRDCLLELDRISDHPDYSSYLMTELPNRADKSTQATNLYLSLVSSSDLPNSIDLVNKYLLSNLKIESRIKRIIISK